MVAKRTGDTIDDLVPAVVSERPPGNQRTIFVTGKQIGTGQIRTAEETTITAIETGEGVEAEIGRGGPRDEASRQKRGKYVTIEAIEGEVTIAVNAISLRPMIHPSPPIFGLRRLRYQSRVPLAPLLPQPAVI